MSLMAELIVNLLYPVTLPVSLFSILNDSFIDSHLFGDSCMCASAVFSQRSILEYDCIFTFLKPQLQCDNPFVALVRASDNILMGIN